MVEHGFAHPQTEDPEPVEVDPPFAGACATACCVKSTTANAPVAIAEVGTRARMAGLDCGLSKTSVGGNERKVEPEWCRVEGKGASDLRPGLVG